MGMTRARAAGGRQPGCRTRVLLPLASHLAHLTGGELDGFAAHRLGEGWEEDTASPGEQAGERVGNGGMAEAGWG